MALNLDAHHVRGDNKGRDPFRRSPLPLALAQMSICIAVYMRLPFLVSVDLPTTSNALRSCIHMRHVTIVVDLCQAKRRSKISVRLNVVRNPP